ncbi:response regulator transcription factor [Actinophytocola sp.]|uniref:helix-turn-helix transcriptional regulator n=1 Tax=Actinophytocola sp. TaxID=1872138 RepID=UPI0038998BC7
MTQSGLEHVSERGGQGADEMAPPLAGDLDAALLLLRDLLDRHARAMREVEAIVVRLLEISSTSRPDGCPAPAGPVPELLTRQEFRVLEQMCRARTNRQIARTLGITEKTAKNYVQAVFRKLGVHSRMEAVLMAARHQWFASGEQQVTRPAHLHQLRAAGGGSHRERTRRSGVRHQEREVDDAVAGPHRLAK